MALKVGKFACHEYKLPNVRSFSILQDIFKAVELIAVYTLSFVQLQATLAAKNLRF